MEYKDEERGRKMNDVLSGSSISVNSSYSSGKFPI